MNLSSPIIKWISNRGLRAIFPDHVSATERAAGPLPRPDVPDCSSIFVLSVRRHCVYMQTYFILAKPVLSQWPWRPIASKCTTGDKDTSRQEAQSIQVKDVWQSSRVV